MATEPGSQIENELSSDNLDRVCSLNEDLAVDDGNIFESSELNDYLANLPRELSQKLESADGTAVNHGACAEISGPKTTTLCPSSARPSAESSGVVTKSIEIPRFITCFTSTITLAASHFLNRTITFKKKPPVSEEEYVSSLRLPPQLESCFTNRPQISEEVSVENTTNQSTTPPKFNGCRKRKRMSLGVLEEDLDSHDKFVKRFCEPSQEDLDSSFENAFASSKLPFIYKCHCTKDDECAAKCAEKATFFRLFVRVESSLIHRSQKIYDYLKEENLEGGPLCGLSAAVAASAVQTKYSNKKTLVPVPQKLSDSLNVVQNIPASPQLMNLEGLHVGSTVRQVVNDLVDFVDRQSNFKEPELDLDYEIENVQENISTQSEGKPEGSDGKRFTVKSKAKESNKVIRALKKLANISITEETTQLPVDSKETVCVLQSCRLGCICASIKSKPMYLEHCRNAKCQFECCCSWKSHYAYEEATNLAKHEKSWHQTVVRKGDELEIKFELEGEKRKKKAPQRFEYTQPFYQSRKLKQKAAQDKTDDKTSQTKTVAQAVKTPTKPQIGYHLPSLHVKLQKFLKGRNLCIGDLFIWCATHNKYDCDCSLLNIAVFKENCVVDNISICDGHVTVQEDPKTPFAVFPNKEVFWFDQEEQCARTALPIIKYKIRNKTPIFKHKVRFLVHNDVMSYTNSIVKASMHKVVSVQRNVSGIALGKVNRTIGELIHVGKTLEHGNVSVVDDSLRKRAAPRPVCEESIELTAEEEPAVMIPTDPEEFGEIVPKPQNSKSSSKFSPCFSVCKGADPNDSDSSDSVEFVNEIKPGEVLVEISDDEEEPVDKKEEEKPIETKTVVAAEDEIIELDDDDDEEEKEEDSTGGYPTHGLICLTRPDLGYFKVLEATFGRLVMEDPFTPGAFRIFKDAKEASEKINELLENSDQSDSSKPQWSLVTGGLLKQYKSQRFCDMFNVTKPSGAAPGFVSITNSIARNSLSNTISTNQVAASTQENPRSLLRNLRLVPYNPKINFVNPNKLLSIDGKARPHVVIRAPGGVAQVVQPVIRPPQILRTVVSKPCAVSPVAIPKSIDGVPTASVLWVDSNKTPPSTAKLQGNYTIDSFIPDQVAPPSAVLPSLPKNNNVLKWWPPGKSPQNHSEPILVKKTTPQIISTKRKPPTSLLPPRVVSSSAVKTTASGKKMYTAIVMDKNQRQSKPFVSVSPKAPVSLLQKRS